jgi:hypothetical protein
MNNMEHVGYCIIAILIMAGLCGLQLKCQMRRYKKEQEKKK